jgi:hypothetical protein
MVGIVPAPTGADYGNLYVTYLAANSSEFSYYTKLHNFVKRIEA